jgi:membrane protein YqaA with SNARE-associated domain
MFLYAFAFLWGFAEATLFFIVPDVLLSFVALRSRRRALTAAAVAALGALPGGMLMYAWSSHDAQQAAALVETVPAIAPALLAQVREQMHGRGPVAVAIGPYVGWPYKVYAIEAREAGVGPLAFAAITWPARASRFLLVALLASAVSRALERWVPLRRRELALAVIWIAIYAQYWSSMQW